MINIRIGESKKLQGMYSMYVSFKYNPEYVSKIKNLPQRVYNADTTTWECSLECMPMLLNAIPNEDYTINGKYVELVKDKASVESVKASFEFKTTPFNHQLDGFNYGLSHNNWLLGDEQGLGKALSLDTKIYTYPTGYKLMRDIEVGDYVYGKNGMPTKVTATFYHKDVEMYRFTFSDGVSIDCCKDHLWEIHTQHGYKVVDTNWFLQKNQFGIVRKDKLFSGGSYNYYIDRCDPVQFRFMPVEINPYVLGALLGDGCLSGGSISFTTKDEELVNHINMYLPEGYVLHSSDSMEDITYNIVRLENTIKPNFIKQEIKNLGLIGTNSHTKFIPDLYKYNSPEIRLAVLQGLLDTDGYATKDNLVQYTTVSKQLSEDVRFLVESLGGICNWYEGACGYGDKITGVAYTLTIRIDDPSKLFMLERKKSLLKPRHFKPRRQIVSIERIKNADAKCITVDSKDHLYLAEHFVVTHNTKQIIDISVAKKFQKGYKHCLIICGVNGLKWNWKNEISIHSNETSRILGEKVLKSGKLTVGSLSDRLNDLNNIDNIKDYFLITNIETLRNAKIVDKLNELTKSKEIGLIAFDEGHKAKDPNSQQGKGLLKLKADNKIVMTGTPLMNNPMDLYSIFKWLGYENKSFYSFKNYYCQMGGYGGYEIVGYRHLDELYKKLNSLMLRRLKDDVLDLPEKTYIDEYVEMSAKQEIIYKEILSDIRSYIDEIKVSPNPLAQLIRLRQATGYTGILSSIVKESAKLDRMEELVKESVENNRKVVIFSNWTDVTAPAFDRLSKLYKGVQITGDIKDEERMANIDAFQNDTNTKFIIGTHSAMGTGLTLTAGTVVIFLDHPWNRALYDQCVDRCHRIGQKNNLTVYNLLTKNTIDERVWELVKEKGELSDNLVDGKITRNMDATLEYLLS